MRSRAPRVVMQRVRGAESIFLDMLAYSCDIAVVEPLQVATWVRSRCVGSSKTTPSRCSATLSYVSWVTDWNSHVGHPLLLSQTQLDASRNDATEEDKKGVTPSTDLVMKLEALVKNGTTSQVRTLEVSSRASCLDQRAVAMYKHQKTCSYSMTLYREGHS